MTCWTTLRSPCGDHGFFTTAATPSARAWAISSESSGFGRREDDRRPPVDRLPAQRAEELDAVHVGHPQVEQHRVERLGRTFQQLHGGPAASRPAGAHCV